MFASLRRRTEPSPTPYQSVSDRSSSSRSSSSRSASSVKMRNPQEKHNLTLETSSTDTRVSQAMLSIQHNIQCGDSKAFPNNLAATVINDGNLMVFDVTEEMIQKHADCTYFLRGIIVPHKPLPEGYHYIFTLQGETSELLPMAGHHALITVGDSELHHGNGEDILADMGPTP